MKQNSSENYQEIYKELGINIDELGCFMLDVDGSKIPAPDPAYLYETQHKEKFWIKGFVAGKTPHITVLFGLMKPASEYKKQIEELIKGIKLDTVTIKNVSYFPSPYIDEPYSCIIAHLEVTPELLAAHQQLQFLPHVDTYPDYKPHVTLAYVKDDPKIRNEVITYYNTLLKGKQLKVKGFNYGDKK